MAKESEEKKEKSVLTKEELDQMAENPGLMRYAHNVGSAQIKPMDRHRVKSRALTAMEQQTDMQIRQIYKQMESLALQAKEIEKRVEVSNNIYSAEMNFEPLVGHTYHLYIKENGKHLLSMIGPGEWGKNKPFKEFVNSVRLLADHTWQIIDNFDVDIS